MICLKIEVAEGHYEYLVIRDQDEPDDIARSFCEKFKLSSKVQEGLSNLIESHIDKMIDSLSPSICTHTMINNPSPKSASPLSTNSQFAGDQNKLDLYYALFDELSDSTTYKISFESLNIQNFSKSMLRILEPIIDELKESGDIIGFSEFTRAMDALLSSLNARDRILLLNYYLEGNPKNKKQEELKNEIKSHKTVIEARVKKTYDSPYKGSRSLSAKYSNHWFILYYLG